MELSPVKFDMKFIGILKSSDQGVALASRMGVMTGIANDIMQAHPGLIAGDHEYPDRKRGVSPVLEGRGSTKSIIRRDGS